MDGLHHIQARRETESAPKEELLPRKAEAGVDGFVCGGVQLLPSGEASCPELWEAAQNVFDAAQKEHNPIKHHALLVEAGEKFSAVVLATGFFPEEKSFALNNIGLILQKLDKIPQADKAFSFAITLNPDNGVIMQNYATIRMCMDDFTGADEWLHKALLKNPKCPAARWNAGLIALLFGDFRRGFINYEWRWRCEQFTWSRIKTCRPQWNGQDLKGKTILLTHEQGFGDSIMMIRYAKMVKAMGAARVRYLCLPELMGIMRGVEGIDEINEFKDINQDGTAGDEDFDFHCPMMSLPRIFKTRINTVPWGGPYLKYKYGPYLRYTAEYAPKPGKKRVGIVWAGRKEHGNDKNRSMKLEQFAPLFDVPGINWYSLQYGERANDVVNFSQIYRPPIKTFEDTAWWINELDLLISVDTAVVHLAGAMGRPVWSLLPLSPDWRWMLERSDSPWYPTLKLFRQKTKGDWAEVVARVKEDLCKLTDSVNFK